MQREFDFSSAFERARELCTNNLQLLLAVAGVFFVIPQLLLGFLVGTADDLSAAMGGVTSFDEIIRILSDFFAENAVSILISIVAGLIGGLTVLVILLDTSRPTVGQAIGIAFSLLLAYVILSILTALMTFAGFLLLILPGIYFSIKLYLAPSIMVAEKQTNPIEAMKASWNLTQGNSLRIFFYLLIIGIVILVINLLVEGIAGLLGFTIGLVVSALFAGVVSVFNLAVAAGVYQELRGPVTEDLTDMFG